MLIPERRRGVEFLDSPKVDSALRQRSLGNVARSNVWFGGRRAARMALDGVLATLGPRVTLLDVGTGTADLPAAIRERARRRRQEVVTIGIDLSGDVLRAANDRLSGAACASAVALPFADASIDVVFSSQLLHHFFDEELERLLRELHRVAKHAVVISDLRRSWVAAAGFWIGSRALAFDVITRHDGIVSVLRGFRPRELGTLVTRAVGVTPAVRTRLGYRLTAVWPASTRSRSTLGDVPLGRRMTTVDDTVVRAPLRVIFDLAARVEDWPKHLPHYRLVRDHDSSNGQRVVEMSANRPFGLLQWPTWWVSHMDVIAPDSGSRPAVRFRHVAGVTKGMDVEWRFDEVAGGTRVRIIHVWDGPPVPIFGSMLARAVIGPVFVHGIASRTLAGLAKVAERTASNTI